MVEKTIQDYYEQIFAEFPTIPQEDIKRILQYGYKSLYLHNSYGGDVLIKRNEFWFYVGSLMKNSLSFYRYYRMKMRVKLRVMYKRKKIPWDGYYYFGLTANQYQEYLDQHNKKGRPRKNFVFNNVFMYKIYDECAALDSAYVALFRIPTLTDYKFVRYEKKLVTDKAELILTRKPPKFSDIVLSAFDYQFITDYQRRYKPRKV